MGERSNFLSTRTKRSILSLGGILLSMMITFCPLRLHNPPLTLKSIPIKSSYRIAMESFSAISSSSCNRRFSSIVDILSFAREIFQWDIFLLLVWAQGLKIFPPKVILAYPVIDKVPG